MRTLHRLWLALLVGASSMSLAAPPAKPRLELVYLGNEGVLLEAGGQQVTIDALHRQFPRPPYYAHLPEPHRTRLEEAQPPFERVRLHLTTHVHLDHFNGEAVSRVLAEVPGAKVVGPPEISAEVCRAQDAGTCGPLPGLQEVSVKPGAERELTFGKMRVTVLDLPHAEGARTTVTNLGYLVSLGGVRVLHVGDANLSKEAFARFRLKERRIDVALVPYWFFATEEGRRLISEQIGAQQVVAFHIPPEEAKVVSEQLHQLEPGARALTRLLQTERF